MAASQKRNSHLAFTQQLTFTSARLKTQVTCASAPSYLAACRTMWRGTKPTRQRSIPSVTQIAAIAVSSFPSTIDVPFRPRRASSDPPCGGRPGQDGVLDRATTPPETSLRPRRRLRPHPHPRWRASPTSEAIRDKTRHVRLLFAPLDHIVIEYPLLSFVRPQGPSHRFVVVVVRGGGARIELGAMGEERAKGGAAAIAASAVVSWLGSRTTHFAPRVHLRRRVVFSSRRVFLHPVVSLLRRCPQSRR